jgi:hypothetical protein
VFEQIILQRLNIIDDVVSTDMLYQMLSQSSDERRGPHIEYIVDEAPHWLQQ